MSSCCFQRYVKGLMVHMTTYLVELSNKNDLKNVVQQPDIIMSVRISKFKCRIL